MAVRQPTLGRAALVRALNVPPQIAANIATSGHSPRGAKYPGLLIAE